MTRVVISQPMVFPWVGMFEQIRAADIYVHYDDVQFSKGSFTNRVQIKTPSGPRWLTVPVRAHLGDAIADVRLAGADGDGDGSGGGARDDGGSDRGQDWRSRHLALLERAFAGAPFAADALGLVQDVYGRGHQRLGDLVVAGLEAVLRYFELGAGVRFLRSSALGVTGKSWPRVLDIVKHLGGDVYVTGHGARDYLDHQAFEAAGVRVEYLDYERRPYPQLHGDFTPYLSILDLIANVGRDGRDVIVSGTKPWREFLRAG
jgi:hypothetical protein